MDRRDVTDVQLGEGRRFCLGRLGHPECHDKTVQARPGRQEGLSRTDAAHLGEMESIQDLCLYAPLALEGQQPGCSGKKIKLIFMLTGKKCRFADFA